MCMESVAWINNVHYVLEMLYFLAGISVAVGVIYSIRQYALSKKDVDLKYSREINAVTTDQMKVFYTEVVPLYEELKDRIKGLFYFDTKVNLVKVDDEGIIKSAANYYESLTDKDFFRKQAKKILINVQLMSTNFLLGTADEELAKGLIFDKYLCIFEAMFPVLMIEQDKSLYQPCVDLYNKWRLEKKTMENKHNTEQLKEAEKQIKPFKANK